MGPGEMAETIANVNSENNGNHPAEDVDPQVSNIPAIPPLGMTETARAVAWKCQKCNTIVPEPRVRCSACRSWKGGQRKPYTKSRSKAAQKRKEREANETLSMLAEEAEEKRASQRRRNKERFLELVREQKEGKNKEDTPLRHNLSSHSPKDVSSGSRSLHLSEIQVGDADFTSPLTRNSSFESVASIDSNVTAADKVRAIGRADDEDGDGGASDNEGDGDFELDVFVKADPEMRDLDVEMSLRDDIANYEESAIPGAPEGWVPPTDPEGWEQTKIPTAAQVPNFQDVDNPGGWTNYPFRAKFSKDGKYKWHAMPAGARPCPLNRNGVRKHGDWEFFYEGWKLEQTLPEAIRNNLPEDVTLVSKYSRGGATRENLFPSDRQGSLDADLLRKLGLTTQRINDQDALFFYQLLLPMVDPKRSGIVDDPRHAYYTIKNQLTNKYAFDRQQSSTIF